MTRASTACSSSASRRRECTAARCAVCEHRGGTAATFYANAASAEAAGFRPCLRCRPELAPGAAPVDAAQRVANTAVARIEAGALERRRRRRPGGRAGYQLAAAAPRGRGRVRREPAGAWRKPAPAARQAAADRYVAARDRRGVRAAASPACGSSIACFAAVPAQPAFAAQAERRSQPRPGSRSCSSSAFGRRWPGCR